MQLLHQRAASRQPADRLQPKPTWTRGAVLGPLCLHCLVA